MNSIFFQLCVREREREKKKKTQRTKRKSEQAKSNVHKNVKTAKLRHKKSSKLK